MRRTRWVMLLALGGTMIALADEPRPAVKDEALKNSLEPPPPLPRRSPSPPPADPLQRLQGEVDDFRKARDDSPPKPPAAPPNDEPPLVGSGQTADEREKLRLRMLELIEEIRRSRAAPPPAAPSAHESPATPGVPMPPADRLRQAQNLFRAGDPKAAQMALQLIDPGTLHGKQPALHKYMVASCYRRLGQTAQARQLYAELAESKDDDFLAECAAWQLQAIATRAELSTPLVTSRTTSAGK